MDHLVPAFEKEPEEFFTFPSTPIPQGLEEYFTNSKKLTLPDESKRKIIDFCKKEDIFAKQEALKKEQQEISDLLELQQAQQETLAFFERRNATLKTRCINLRDKAVELQNELQQKRVGPDNKKITDLKKLKKPFHHHKNCPQNPKNRVSNLPPMQSLMRQFGATDIACLKYRLNDLCNDLENGERRNDAINGPYSNNGVLYYGINDANACTFDSQSAKLTLVKHPFSTFHIKISSSSESSSSHADNDNELVEQI